MNLIAVLLDENGKTCSWQTNGLIKLYQKELEEWIEIKSIPYSLPLNCDLVTLRETFSELLTKLENCKIFVAKKFSGLLISILESYNYNLYELNGIPSIFLDSILISEEKLKRERAFLTAQINNNFSPTKLDNSGNFTINLKDILNSNYNVSSKQILKPFLEKETFRSLEVICDHVPKWFDKALSGMGYDFQINSSDNIINVLILPKQSSN